MDLKSPRLKVAGNSQLVREYAENMKHASPRQCGLKNKCPAHAGHLNSLKIRTRWLRNSRSAR
jgi:hypothetical protein